MAASWSGGHSDSHSTGPSTRAQNCSNSSRRRRGAARIAGGLAADGVVYARDSLNGACRARLDMGGIGRLCGRPRYHQPEHRQCGYAPAPLRRRVHPRRSTAAMCNVSSVAATCRSSGGSCSNLRRSTRWSRGVQGQSTVKRRTRRWLRHKNWSGRSVASSFPPLRPVFRRACQSGRQQHTKFILGIQANGNNLGQPCSGCAPLLPVFHGAAQRWIRA